METSNYQRLWTRWMKPYLAERAGGRPRRLTNSETEPMLGWIENLNVPEEIDAGAELLIQAETGFSNKDRFVQFPLTADTLAKTPAAWAALLASILRHTTSLPTSGFQIVQATAQLETLGVAAGDIAAIRERLYELGALVDVVTGTEE